MSKDDEYIVDLENDEAVRIMCIVHNKKLEEYVPPPPEVDPAAEAKAAAAGKVVSDPKAETFTRRGTLPSEAR